MQLILMEAEYYHSQIRVMRIVVIYDLPTESKKNTHDYTLFHSFLLRNGFYMMQYSIYCCLARNHDFAAKLIEKVGANCPKSGDVRCFKITEKQYQNIIIFTGSKSLQEQMITMDPLVEV